MHCRPDGAFLSTCTGLITAVGIRFVKGSLVRDGLDGVTKGGEGCQCGVGQNYLMPLKCKSPKSMLERPHSSCHDLRLRLSPPLGQPSSALGAVPETFFAASANTRN